MKKVFIAFMALTALLIITSCNNSTKVLQPGSSEFTFTATCDTSITVQVPITSSINLCSGGKSQYKKIVSYGDSTIHLKKNEKITLSNEYMNGEGWYYFPKGIVPTLPDSTTATTSNSSFNWMPDWLKEILAFLFWVVLILLALMLGAWLLRELWRLLNRPARNVTSEHNVVVEDNQVVTNPVQRPTPPNPATVAEITALTGLVAAMGKGGGGTVNGNGLDIEIYGVESPLIHVENSGSDSQSGDINIHVGDDNAVAEKLSNK